MRWIQNPQRVTVPASDTLNVVMYRQDRAFRELTIWVRPVNSRVPGSSAGVRDFTYEVFFGPTSQGAAAPRVNDEVFLAYDPGSTGRIWPANDRTSNWARGPRSKVHGFDITVQFVNGAVTPLVLDVEFDAMTIDLG